MSVLANGDLVSLSCDSTINVWDVESGTIKMTMFGFASTRYTKAPINVLKNNDIVVSCKTGKSLVILDSTNYAYKSVLNSGSFATCFKNLPNGHLVAGQYDGFIRVWNPANGELVGDYTDNYNIFWTVEYLGNGNYASGTDQGEIMLWSLP